MAKPIPKAVCTGIVVLPIEKSCCSIENCRYKTNTKANVIKEARQHFITVLLRSKNITAEEKAKKPNKI